MLRDRIAAAASGVLKKSYDSLGNKLLATVAGSDGAVTNVTQYFVRFTWASDIGQFHIIWTGDSNGFDGFGRRTSATSPMGGVTRTVSRQYDFDGNLTRVTHPDTNYFQYSNDGLVRFTAILENGSTSIVGQTYFTDGLRSAQARGGVTTNYAYQNMTMFRLENDLEDWPRLRTCKHGRWARGRRPLGCW